MSYNRIKAMTDADTLFKISWDKEDSSRGFIYGIHEYATEEQARNFDNTVKNSDGKILTIEGKEYKDGKLVSQGIEIYFSK